MVMSAKSPVPRALVIGMAFLLIVITIGVVLASLRLKDERVVSLSSALTAWATVVLAVVTVWAVTFQTSTADRVAQVQMLQAFAARYEAESLARARSTLARMKLANQGISPGSADRVLDFLEGLAFFVRQEHLRYEVAENEYSLAVRVYWALLKTYVEKMRVDYADPTYYEHLEWLNDRFQEAYASESGSTYSGAAITDKQANGFFKSESTASDL